MKLTDDVFLNETRREKLAYDALLAKEAARDTRKLPSPVKVEMPDADFRIENQGTVWMFTPLTDTAREFINDSVQTESFMWLGNSLCIDHRPARDFAGYLIGEGFRCVS